MRRQGGSLSLGNSCQEKQRFLYCPFQVGVVRVLQRVQDSHWSGCAAGGRPGELWSVRTKDFLLPSPLLCLNAAQLHLQFDLSCR